MNKIDLRQAKNSGGRRKQLEDGLEISLSNVGETPLDDSHFAGHCENAIGTTQIPLGVAGPLKIESGKWKIENGYIPLATTEGALVASVNRGCKAVTSAGGVYVDVEKVGISRGPVFKVDSVREGREVASWIDKHTSTLDALAKETSSHISLLSAQSQVVGKNLFVRFSFDTQDAMGMNMATIATQTIVDAIEKEHNCRCVALAGNFDIDKKPAWLNALYGRGYRVSAEVVIPKTTLKETLKADADSIVDVVYRKSHVGSMVSGSLGFNAHFANIVAALYAATGQDLAHTVEGSLGITTAEAESNGDLYFSITMPSVVVGTIGGGTSLPTQKEALSILGIKDGKGEATKFAALVGAAVLAGELSLTASIAEGSLARTHDKFRKTKFEARSTKSETSSNVINSNT